MGQVLEFKPREKSTLPAFKKLSVAFESDNTKSPKAETIHLMTQDGQGYGSQRRCCENCGRMIVTTNLAWTDDRKFYDNPGRDFIRCMDLPRDKR